MIGFSTEELTPLVGQMWKTCFGDSDEAIELFFSKKYRPQNTLLYFERGKPVASLQMIPYTMTFFGEIIDFYYLAGLCTLPQYRSKGYMAQLMVHAHCVMAERSIPLSILIPAGEDLFSYYHKFGYERAFTKGTEPLYPLVDILAKHSTLQSAYLEFKERYCSGDFTVQKTFDDFIAIVDDYGMFNCPDKYNLWGMARIIDAEKLKHIAMTRGGRGDFDLAEYNPIMNFMLE